MYKFGRKLFSKSLQRAGLAAALAMSALVASSPVTAQATQDIVVKYDQSELLPLPKPAAQVIVGNPAIADITIKSDRMLVVTGKTFGITNMIVLDSQDKIILNQRVLVRRDEASVINLQRGTSRQSYNCTPECNPSIVVGDDTGYFNVISSASQNKVGMSERAADSSQGQMPVNTQPPPEAPGRRQ
jgi:Flp pilus assembly secretin CpaC